MRIARVTAVVAVFAGVVLFAALQAPSAGEVIRLPIVDLEGRASSGATLDLDSVRAERQRILMQISRSDTYLPAMLAQGDSMLRRWPERMHRPLTVHLTPGAVTGVTPAHAQAVQDAFLRWQRVASIPVQFRFVRDSSKAEVKVRWVRTFPVRRAGQADVVWNKRGWLVEASLTLATHTTEGHPLSPEAVYTVALHEIGHLLGLGHSDAPGDVMYPTTSVHDLTFRDRHTARLLYTLPPGSLRSPELTR
jgi:hypothetical protein